jgi:glycosyltransferase involved in cell wall biosynthesis
VVASPALTDVRDQQLLIVSHVVHFQRDGKLFAYEPYAREIDVWATIFRDVVIAAPVRAAPPEASCAEFEAASISVVPMPEVGGDSLPRKAKLVLSIPRIAWSLWRAMRASDAVHVRCPGNLGLIGAMVAPLSGRPMIAKYAGQWSNYPGEPRTVRLQKLLLRSRWWRGPVTVYDDGGPRSPNVIPFFTSVLDGEQIARARVSAAQPRPRATDPLRVLFVGRLTESKNAKAVVGAVLALRERGLDVELDVLGDGPCAGSLKTLIARADAKEQVRLRGSVPFEAVLDHYRSADVLALVSATEGWPKSVSEAMTFGLICVGSDRGMLPQMLGEGRGIVVEAGNETTLTAAIESIFRSPGDFRKMSRAASEWGQTHSLDSLRSALVALMKREWDG